MGVLKAAQFELEKSGVQSWDKMYHFSLTDDKRTEFSSRIFHRHQGEGLAYSVISSADDIAARGAGDWDGHHGGNWGNASRWNGSGSGTGGNGNGGNGSSCGGGGIPKRA